jgi:hypothetical protein
MSSVISVAVHFKREAGSYFTCKENTRHAPGSLSSAEPYEFLVKLRNITWETNYVIVSQNALGMMERLKLRLSTIGLTPPPSRTTKCPLLSLHYPYNPI